MSEQTLKTLNKSLRKGRVRSKISGTADRPRLTVSISNMHITVQLIDDVKQHTLVSSSTVGSKFTGTTTEKAALIDQYESQRKPE